MTCRRYQKLNQYLHVSDRANEPAQNNADYDKLYKICPVLNMVQDSHAESYTSGQNQTIDEGMMPLMADLVMYNTYLPNGSREELIYECTVMLIQHICINLRCIMVNRKTEFGLGYYVVMKLCKDISGKYHHVYCDNLFTSVQLLKDLLAWLQQGKPKKVYSSWLLTCDCIGIDCWIFISKKEGRMPTLHWACDNCKHMKMSTWAQRRERDVNGTVCSRWGKKLYMDVTFAMYTCVKMDAILPTIINNIELSLNFFFIFETSLDISTKCFMSIVRLIWHSYKSFLDCLSQLFNTCPLDYCDGWGGLSHQRLKQLPPANF